MSLARGLMVLAAFALAAFAGFGTAQADLPLPWQIGMQPPATTVAERVHALHDLLLWIITGISLFVLALLVIVILRFRESRNPTPSRTSHNTVVEVIWTVVPVLILVAIAIPSFRLLYYTHKVEDAEMTLKAVGHQWYWSYEYPDHGGFTFDAILVPEEELEPGQHRLLETDNTVVLPVDTNIRLITTASDVLHAWAIPAFGVKLDSIPGRANEIWFRITREGTFYGQCSELCGIGHAYMPIKVQAVSREAFADWVAQAQAMYPKADGAPTDVATAQ